MSDLLLVAGSIASNYRNGGIAWERLSWVLGLRRLGFEVLLVDQLDRARCVHPEGAEPSYENCLNRDYFEAVIQQFGLEGAAVLIGEGGEPLYGPDPDTLLELAGEATALVNVAGNLRYARVKGAVRRRVLVDVDPGFTHLWLASGRPAPRIEGHDLHFTIGENVGLPGCPLSTHGLTWRHTRQPVLLDEWPVAAADERGEVRFTTVGTWRGVGPHGGLDGVGSDFGQKGDELERLIELPRRVPNAFEIALRAPAGAAGPERLADHGWSLVDPVSVAGSPDAFRRYVQSSGAEFSVAKGIYVDTWSGWFSDRTTRYLASGKPALVQDTGFGRTLPVGEGLLAFQGLDDAVEGVRRIAADPAAHSEAARRIAEEHLDSDVILRRFADEMVSAPITGRP